MKKRKLSFLTYLSTGIIAASGIGVGSYYLYKAISNADEVIEGYVELGKPKTIWFNSGKLNVGQEGAAQAWDFQIKVYPFSDGSFWLGDEGLEKLRKRIKSKLYHGQEITTLDDIVLGNVNMISEGSNGLYFPLTKEIFLNIESWKRYNELLSDQQKIDGIMSTVTHEYGHHIANMYLNTARSKDAWTGDQGNIPTVYNNDGSRGKTHWNKKFAKKFYEDMHYNDKTLLNTKAGIQTSAFSIESSGYTSIASKLSLYDLFWHGNTNRDINYSNKNVFSLPGKIFSLPGKNTKKISKKIYKRLRIGYQDHGAPNQDWYIKYKYSLDEIITRQLGQLMHVYDIPADKSLIGHMRRTTSKAHIILDSFVSDARSSSQIYVNNSGNDFIQEDFYKDSIFRNTTQPREIYNDFRTAMGYHRLISNVYGLNETFAIVDKHTGNKYVQYENGDLNQNKLQITGWTPKSVKGIYYGKMDSNSLSQTSLEKNVMTFGDENERKKLWQFDRKGSIFDQDPIDSKSFDDDWLPFATNKYIDALNKDVKDYKFKWWNDKNDDNKITKDEIISTSDILKKFTNINKQEVINDTLPVSTFRQSWDEEKVFPRINYVKNEITIDEY